MMKKKTSFVLALFIVITMIASAVIAKETYAATLILTVTASKPIYWRGENIMLYGELTYGGAPVAGNLVGLQIKNPDGDIVVSRTLTTNDTGGYNLAFQLPSDATKGTYQVFVSSTYKGQQATASTIFQYEYAPAISISPQTVTVDINVDFSINVTLDYAERLYGFEFWLSFDNTKITATSLDYTNYLNEPSMIWYQQINNTGGYVTLAVSSLNPATGKTGGGDLAIIHFQSLAVGISQLHLYKTILADDKGMTIAHTTVDGKVHVGKIHDIAVTNVTPLKTIVGQGLCMNINVTVANQGDFEETFNLRLFATGPNVNVVSIHLFGASSSISNGWGFSIDSITSPGPTIAVRKGDLINLTLTSADMIKHNFFVDYDGDGIYDPDEPRSGDFPGIDLVPTINYQFKAKRAGTFRYYCEYDKDVMYGTFIVSEPQLITTPVDTKEITLTAGSSADIKFTWNTTGYAQESYVIWAYAEPVLGEKETGNNSFYDGLVLVTIVGDVNGDGTVDIYDLILVASAFGANQGGPGYSPNSDINNDGTIDIYDLILVASHFGENSP